MNDCPLNFSTYKSLFFLTKDYRTDINQKVTNIIIKMINQMRMYNVCFVIFNFVLFARSKLLPAHRDRYFSKYMDRSIL